MVECCFTSTETIGLLGTGGQDGHLDLHTAPELWRWGKRDYIYIYIYIERERERERETHTHTHTHRETDSCIKMGSDDSHFNVSLIVRDKVTRRCPQTTTLLKRKENRSGIERRPYCLITSLTPYR